MNDKIIMNKILFTDDVLNSHLGIFVSNAYNIGFNVDSVYYEGHIGTHLFGKNSRLNLNSCAKTITSIAMGMLLNEYKYVSLDDFVVDYFPSYRTHIPIYTQSITIKNLLQMNSGKNMRSLLSLPSQKKWKNDWLSWFLEKEHDNKPGESFYYSSHCCYTIARIIEVVSKEDINLFLKRRLWDLLGIQTPQWDKCPMGFSIGAGNIWMTCNDLSKLGSLLLHNGVWQKRQIINASYMSTMINDVVPSNDPFGWNDEECNQGYGLFLWKCSPNQTFRMWGAGGNFSIIDYFNNCCLTITASCDPKSWILKNDHDLARLAYDLIQSLN